MKTDRREFLRGTAWMGAAALAAGCSNMRFFTGTEGAPMQGFRCAPMKRIRVGIVGLGGRGMGPVYRLPTIPGVEVTALCEIVPEKIAAAQKDMTERGFPKAKEYLGPEAYKALCESDDVDVVYSATPWHLHTPIALYAMEHGKHVFTEVPAAMSVEECWAQVETAERTRRHCMQLENCCYGEIELLALNLCRKGLLGELIHGEAGYIHDLSHHALTKEGDNEWWRLNWNAVHKGNQYPTHGLGPISQYMGINRGDQYDYLVSLESKQMRMTAIAEAKKAGRFLGKELEMGDMNLSLIRTKLGRSILLGHDVSSARPYTRYNTIVGSKGIVTDYPFRVALNPDVTGGPAHNGYFKGPEAERIRKENMHPVWKAVGEFGRKVGGHGGMDFIMDLRWCYCLLNGLPLDMDVYDLAAWSSMCELTERSVRGRSKTVDCVDFTRGAWRTTEPLGIVTMDISGMTFKGFAPMHGCKPIKEAAFYGTFPKAAVYRTAKEAEAAGLSPQALKAEGDTFRLEPFGGDKLGGGLPDLAGLLVFKKTCAEAKTVKLGERNDYFGTVYVNGREVVKETDGSERWQYFDLPLAKGENEIVFRTAPGNSGEWYTALALQE